VGLDVVELVMQCEESFDVKRRLTGWSRCDKRRWASSSLSESRLASESRLGRPSPVSLSESRLAVRVP